MEGKTHKSLWYILAQNLFSYIFLPRAACVPMKGVSHFFQFAFEFTIVKEDISLTFTMHTFVLQTHTCLVVVKP